ncbi:MAG: DUF6600 domain-containing protein [Acidobacteriota bacterium]
MRTTIRRAGLMIAAALMVITPTPPTEADSFSIHVGNAHFGMSVGFGDWGAYGDSWYDRTGSLDYTYALDGYGEWIWVHGLGRVWRPSVTTSWRPYTQGRWVHTDLGWTWVSYEPWGYIPHHYGEWALTMHGWAWVPGYTYRPANVVWLHSGGSVGWYARPPRGWSHHQRGYHHSYDRGYRRGFDRGYDRGYWDGWEDARHATYVPWKHMGADNVAHYARGRNQNFVKGKVQRMQRAPSRHDVRRAGAKVHDAQLDRRTVTMGDREVTMARPRGMTESVERHGRRAAKQVLTDDAHKNLDRRQTSNRHTAIDRGQRRGAAKNDRRAPDGRDRRISDDRRSPNGDHKRGTLTQERRFNDERRPPTDDHKRAPVNRNREYRNDRSTPTSVAPRRPAEKDRRQRSPEVRGSESEKQTTRRQSTSRPPSDTRRREPANAPEARSGERSRGNKGGSGRR